MKRVLLIKKGVFVLLLALLAGLGTAYAYSFSAVCPTGQTLYYNITDATNHYVEITCPGTSGASSWNGYTKPTGNITLPSTVTYNSVTYIVTSIGNDAFYECSDLTGTLTIPSSVNTIGNDAFHGCSGFTGSLTIPNSVTTIGILAFAGCSGFNGSLTISNSVTTIGYGAFGWCPNFTGTLTLPNSLMAIEDFSFYDSGFSGSLTIPNTVTSIGECAFGICSFTGSLTLGNSLTSIGEYAFAICSGFTGSLSIPNTVTTIGSYAFQDCTGFTGSLTLGNSVTTIGNSAFNSCSSLSGPLTIPNSVTTIGEGAFNNCLQFNGTLVIGTGVTSMGTGAFRYCSRLTSIIVLPETPPTLGTDVFANALMNIPVTVPCGSMTAYQTASGWNAFTNMLEDCDPLTYSINPDGVSVTVTGHVDGTAASGELIIPETKTINGVSYAVTSIGDYAFSYCDRFTGSLTIPNTVTTIGESAFQFCTGFTGSLNLSNSLTTIGISAFQDCHNFTGTLTLPNSLTAIEDFSFFDSGFSGSLTIPNTVTSIGEDAFSNCSFTGSLTLGNSLTSIGDNAFDGCSGFTGSLSIPNSVATIGDRAFWGCTGFTGSLTLGNSVTTIGNWAFWNCAALTGSLIIPNSVTTIGNGAFAWCHDFNGTLIIGTGVTSIGESAFEDCTDLNSIVVYPEIPPTLGSDAFANVLTYIPVTVSCGSMTAYQTASGWNAFTNMQEDCDPLTYSINPDGVSVTVTGHVDGTNATGTLTIPETKTINGVSYTVTAIGDYAFKGCSGLTGDLTIPNSVTSIGNYAFYYCDGFWGSLTIPISVTSIGSSAFYSCWCLSGSLVIPNSVTSIGNRAFAYCHGFTGSLTIPNSVTTIEEEAFYNCDRFTGTLTIPNSVTSIGGYAFYGCSGFTGSLTLGSSLTALGSCVFCNCSNLTSITINNETPPTLGADAFNNVPTTIPVYVPCGSLEDYQAAEGWNEFTNMQCFERLTVYDGTVNSINVPAYIFYFDDFTRSQFVMPAAELADMTGTPITSMTFYTIDNNVPYTTVSSADVYLKEVNYTEISAYEPKASATTVYSGYLDIVSAGSGGEMTIHFTTPYNYQGGNLLIGVENAEDNGWKNIQFYGQTVSGASISGYNASSTGTIPATQQNFIPKTTFGYIPSDCSRPIDLAATDITINSATLDWTGYQDDYDLRYRKRVYFFEDFENGLPSGWTTIDNDGDGYNWHSTNTTTYSHSGSTVMVSYSYNEVTQTGLTPDNWLITPQLDLQGTMKVWLNAFHPSWAQEHFAIYLSTTGNSVSDFTTVLVPETTLTDGQFRAYTADLRAYAGQQGYIAIRHFNCTDMFALLVDDFGIFNAPDGTLEWETINDIEPGYTLNALEPNTDYEWQVRGRDCDGSNTYTEWSAANSFTTKTIVVDEGHPFTEGFEGTTFAPAYWENHTTGSYQWTRNTYSIYVHSGSASAYSSFYGDNYLVMPDLELSANASAAQLTFWSYNSWPNDFTEGNNTVVLLNGGSETVLWSAETVSEEWVENTVDLSDYLGQTIRLAFKYAGSNGNGWYVDDVEVAVTNTYIFLTNGNWNNGSCWNTGTVPPAGSDVIIQANATVPAGYLAVANAVSIQGGSITVADGGQLRHNTSDLVVTMQKNIEGYDDVNGKGNYYLLAFPFFGMVEVPSAMTANEGSDFYDFDPNFQDAEWRNDKQTPINYVYRYAGYLYASPESFVLSVTGSTYALNTEFAATVTVEYDEGSSNPSNGWALLGNPFTYNAYVYAENGDELVPMEVMIYDENGDLQTITCGPIAPMQGFFVHVTETTTVCFRVEAHINDYVDLGLPSGLLWATCNVGANAPEEYGDYFAWGETMPKDVYKWDTYQYGDGSTFTKYSGSDGLTTLLPEDDAATANWGSSWRMPTVEDWEELYNNTTVTWTQQNGVNGRLFTAANGNSLFLPAAGRRWGSEFDGVSIYGFYWSSSLFTGYSVYAWLLGFDSGDYNMLCTDRYGGHCVRPVRSASQN